MYRFAFKGAAAAPALLSLALLAGCVYEEEGPPEAHFESFAAKPPQGNTVSVCHAYGCKVQTPFTFTEADIAEISALMARIRRDQSPAEERRALAYAIGWMERRVAPAIGTENDRPSMDFLGSGDPGQQDCVDEATNTTSYLLVLARNGLVQQHWVERPFAKDDLTHWTHWAAIIKERQSGERYAMDSSSGRNGENPTVQAAASFYVPDSADDQKPPESSPAAPAVASSEDGSMTGLIDRMSGLGYGAAPAADVR